MTQKENFAKAVQEQARIEQQVKGILLMNAAPPRYNHFYTNFGKMIVKLKKKYTGTLLHNEADALQLHWFNRGLDDLILTEIKCFYIYYEGCVMPYPFNPEDDDDSIAAGENRETPIVLLYGYYDVGGVWKRVEVSNAGSLHVSIQDTPVSVEIIHGKTIIEAPFSIAGTTQIVAAPGAGKNIYIVAMSAHNNETTGTNDTVLKIFDGTPTYLYGDATHGVYLPGRGGVWGLPMSVDAPWFVCAANKSFNLLPTNARRVAGVVWYYVE